MDQPPGPRFRSDGQPAPPVVLRPHLVERTHNLPSELTILVGRAEAIAELRRLLLSTRLLTLTGSGGIGKTRLAVALGQTVVPDYSERVWFVDLSPLRDGDLVSRAVANVLGVREDTTRPPLENLADVVGGRRALLVLDNCEHLVAACAALADGLLRA